MKELNAEGAAEAILDDLSLTSLPIVPDVVREKMAMQYFPILYEENADLKEVLGMTIKRNGGAAIILNGNIRNEGRKNFTYAHELGHVAMHLVYGTRSQYVCRESEISEGPSEVDDWEKEANAFAASLLMPEKLIHPFIKGGDVGWKQVNVLAKKCGTSLLATAKRIVRLTKEPLALIAHKDDLLYCFQKSERFTHYIDATRFPKNLDSRTLDGSQNSLEDSWDSCWAAEWLGGISTENKILFDSISIPALNWKLTLLWDNYEDADDGKGWAPPKFSY